MASNDLSSVESLITCSLCSELFEDPRLLSCFHSYCFRCINQSITNDHFTCPSCERIEVAQDEIESLPSNQMIQSIVELYMSMKRLPVCAECESSAKFRCTTCRNSYCSECDKDIHSKRSLSNHSRLPINNKSFETIFCDEHSDTKLKRWCQVCHIPICFECLASTHQGHENTPINESSNELQTKIKVNLEFIESSLIENLKQANQDLEKVNTESELNKNKVSKIMNDLRQIIDEHEKQMSQNIENFQRESIQQIENYRMNLNEQLKYFNLHKNTLDLIISINDQCQLLKNKSNFLNYIYQINQQLEELQIPIGIDYHITGCGLFSNIKEQILQCAVVTESLKQIISIDEGPQMEKLIIQYQTSQDVDLTRQLLTDENISIIFQILNKATRMITLRLSNNQIGPQGVRNLIEILQNNQILTTLDLCYNSICDDGTKYLADYLKNNSILTTLFLYDNGITKQGVEYLSNALKINTTLQVLDLQSNSIDHFGAQYLADALRKNNTLTTLYLSNNQIGNQGALCLAEALQQNTTLTGLSLSDNQIDHKARRDVLEMLKVKAMQRFTIHW